METISGCLLTFLLNSLWQVPLVAAVAALACRWMRQAPARHRHAVWVAALAAAVLLPIASVRPGAEPATAYAIPRVSGGFAAAPAAASPLTGALAQNPSPAPRSRTVPFARTTGIVLLTGYLLFLAFRLSWLAAAWLRTVEIRRTAIAVTPSPLAASVWKRSEAAFGLEGVEWLSSARVSGPVTAGAWRPAIIFPEPLLAEAREEVLATAIGHEMAHVARRDFPLNILYELLSAVISFHPASTAIRRGIDRTREMACDELVTARLLEPSTYARSIMSIAAEIAGAGRPGWTLGVLDGDILEERIQRLMERRGTDLKRARMLLAAGLSALALCVAMASGLALSARAQSAAQPEMKRAVEAYNSGDFKAAVEHFETAVRLDPNHLNARLHLANALIRRFVAEKRYGPDENRQDPLLSEAQQQYREVLARDPHNETAVFGLVALNGPGRAKESHDLMLKLIEHDPKAKNAYYAAGVFDWQMAYGELRRAREAAGMAPPDPQIPDAGVRAKLRAGVMPQIEEGFRMLQIALDKDAASWDAMAYMNLLYRAEAMIADSPAEVERLLARADEWVDKALAAKRRIESQPKVDARITVDAPPPQAVPSPPPPPPPPPGKPAPANPKEGR